MSVATGDGRRATGDGVGPLTKMSRLAPAPITRPTIFRALGPAAHILPFTFWMCAGCIIPLPYQEAGDGGVDYPPVITGSNPPMPGPVGITASAEPALFSIDVADQDLGDTLYVRVFRDYAHAPEPPRNNVPKANDPVAGRPVRTIELQTNTWCQNAQRNVNIVFDVVVADRPFVEDLSVSPVYRAVSPGGEFSVRSWVIECLE